MIGGAKKNEREANILLIVYEHLVRDIMARIFTERGHTVVTCAVGHDGIRTFEKGKRKFDLVMSDISLPGISGFGVAKRIKEISRKTPVILIKGACLASVVLVWQKESKRSVEKPLLYSLRAGKKSWIWRDFKNVVPISLFANPCGWIRY
jgi:DNA-binding NtrC family response regulator